MEKNTLKYYKSLLAYAIQNELNWKTAKRLLERRKIIEMEFKGKKVIISIDDLIRFIFFEISNENKPTNILG